MSFTMDMSGPTTMVARTSAIEALRTHNTREGRVYAEKCGCRMKMRMGSATDFEENGN